MRFSAAINVSAPDGPWDRICPDAQRLARKTARLALIEGMAATNLVPPARVELGIMLAEDAFQQQLNHRYRGRSASTNVLAFPAWEPAMPAPFGAPLLLGDVVLALETIACEALDQRKAFADHFCHLIVHGVLHLLGWDHRSEAEAAEMEVLEISILTKLGIPDPYLTRSIETEAVC